MLLLLVCLIGLAVYLTWLEWHRPEPQKKPEWQLESHQAQERSLARLRLQDLSSKQDK